LWLDCGLNFTLLPDEAGLPRPIQLFAPTQQFDGIPFVSAVVLRPKSLLGWLRDFLGEFLFKFLMADARSLQDGFFPGTTSSAEFDTTAMLSTLIMSNAAPGTLKRSRVNIGERNGGTKRLELATSAVTAHMADVTD
jgi:hypothetical protein